MDKSNNIKPHSLQLERNLSTKFREIYKVADEFLNIQDIICQNLTARGIRAGELSDFVEILSVNFFKATDSLYSVLWLCDLGFTKDAFTIMRKIQEIAITLAFICTDKNRLSIMYRNYYLLSLYSDIKEILKDYDRFSKSSTFTKTELEKFHNDIALKIKDIKSYYKCNSDGEIRQEYFRSWSGVPIKEMARKCDIDYWGYKVASKFTHTSIVDEDVYFDDKNLNFGPNTEYEEIPLIIVNSLLMYHRILIIMDSVIGLNFKDSLKYLEVQLGKYSNHFGKNNHCNTAS